MELRESTITIDGTTLTPIQAMTVRCAINVFLLSLRDMKLDPILHEGYSRSCQEILDIMHERSR